MNIKSVFPRTNKPRLISYLDTFLELCGRQRIFCVLMDGRPTGTRVIWLTAILRRGGNAGVSEERAAVKLPNLHSHTHQKRKEGGWGGRYTVQEILGPECNNLSPS